jgi:BirA family biotin operon repressor/biotin-[acetyl-CoA-carboxylase] ligase
MPMRFSRRALEQGLTTRFVGRRLEYRSALRSTQNLARRLAEAGAPEGTVVLAGRQTAGRGRLGRSWVSPQGGLYFTAVLRPAVQHLRALAIVAALAVARGIEAQTGLACSLKWPNDVLLGERKVSGILMESQLTGERVRYVLVGIGVNVNADLTGHPEIASTATSLRMELGRELSREALAAAILNEIEALYLATQAGQRPHEEWKARLGTLRRQVSVRVGEQVEEGLAEDVDAEGSLILRRADGSRVAISAGDVTLRA